MRNEPPAENPIVCVSLDVFLAMEFPPRRMLLTPWLQGSSINMLTAYRGTGKTWATLSIAMAVASGGRFLKFEAPEPAHVLYVDGEMSGKDLQKRIKLISGQFPDFDPNNFDMITPDLQDRPMPDLSTLKGQVELDLWTNRADLIVIDNLSALARSGVENEAESWNSVATWALRMRREGRAVLFVHHAGKNGQQRGTSKREDLLDTSILLNRPMDAKDDGASFVWEWSKARGLYGNDLEPLQAELVQNAFGGVSWSCRASADVQLQQVAELKAEHRTVRQIAEELGMSKSAVGRALKRLENCPTEGEG